MKREDALVCRSGRLQNDLLQPQLEVHRNPLATGWRASHSEAFSVRRESACFGMFCCDKTHIGTVVSIAEAVVGHGCPYVKNSQLVLKGRNCFFQSDANFFGKLLFSDLQTA